MPSAADLCSILSVENRAGAPSHHRLPKKRLRESARLRHPSAPQSWLRLRRPRRPTPLHLSKLFVKLNGIFFAAGLLLRSFTDGLLLHSQDLSSCGFVRPILKSRSARYKWLQRLLEGQGLGDLGEQVVELCENVFSEGLSAPVRLERKRSCSRKLWRHLGSFASSKRSVF